MSTETPKETKLNFKPLNEGLGLNHFVDGLPYTPAAAKKRAAMPMLTPAPRSPRYETKPIPTLQRPTVQVPVTQRQVELPRKVQQELSETLVQSASIFKRTLAYFFDLSVVFALFGGIFLLSIRMNQVSLREFFSTYLHNSKEIQTSMLGLLLSLNFTYFTLIEGLWRTTLGKAILGLRIRTTSTVAVIFRSFVFYVSVLPFGFGIIWALFDSKGRCWHDTVTDTEVIQ